MPEIKKMNLEAADLVAERIETLRNLFPEIVTEGEGSIDFDKLRLILGDNVEDDAERYAFTWPGKAAAIRQSQTSSDATLRPCIDKSRGRDGQDGSFDSDNIYIEGDNLEVLKLLQRGYHGRIKMIYIDPPYNKAGDFVYHDDFTNPLQNYKAQAGLIGQSNPDVGGRLHSDWCSMMYPRLRLARELLSDDGVIFISIDNKEVRNARLLCDEIYGEEAFIAQFVWEKKKKGSFLSNSITNVIEYVLCYAKNANNVRPLIGEINDKRETYPCVNAVNSRELRVIPPGVPSKYREQNYFLKKGSVISNSTMSLVLHSDLVLENGQLAEELVIEGNWRYSQDTMEQLAREGALYITQDLYLRRVVTDTRIKRMKDLLSREGADRTTVASNYDPNDLFASGWGSNEDADEELRRLMGVQKLLEYPKPVALIAKLICCCRLDPGDIVLDFFSGSATTAHAVMLNNLRVSSCQKFILVQLPEICKKGTPASQAGYMTICDIGEERIRQAGNDLMQNEQIDKTPIDIGFRVLTLDSSNIQAPLPGELLSDVVRSDRSDLDIVFEMMLKWGLELTLPIERADAAGYSVWSVACGELVCCMAEGLTHEALGAIAAMEPRRVLILDSILTDSLKLNAIETFKHAGERSGREIELRTI